MIETTGRNEKPLADILNNVGAELLHLDQLVERLQLTVSPLLRTAACTREFRMDIQSLDLATQQIRGLAAVVGGLALVVAPGWLVDPRRVVATLPLQALADRICGEASTNDHENDGGCELL